MLPLLLLLPGIGSSQATAPCPAAGAEIRGREDKCHPCPPGALPLGLQMLAVVCSVGVCAPPHHHMALES